jgi:hypothetical protein
LNLIPQPTSILTDRVKNGDWWIGFGVGFFERPDGTAFGTFVNWDLHVWVTPDGQCYGGGIIPRDLLQPRRAPGALPAGFVNEAVAILLAKSFAVAHGLLRPDTQVEEREAEDGGWVVAFTPGLYYSPPGSASQPLGFAPCAIRVDPEGRCEVISS